MAIRPARRLPAHCSVAVTSRCAECLAQVVSDSSSSRSTCAMDPQPPRVLVDLGDLAVPADVEGVRGGERALHQGGAARSRR